MTFLLSSKSGFNFGFLVVGLFPMPDCDRGLDSRVKVLPSAANERALLVQPCGAWLSAQSRHIPALLAGNFADTASADITVSKQQGRPFAAGVSGNPDGRPKGSRNKHRLQ